LIPKAILVIIPLLGLWSDMEPPVPIPNTEVKRISADDSLPATERENRSRPGIFFGFNPPLGNQSANQRRTPGGV